MRNILICSLVCICLISHGQDTLVMADGSLKLVRIMKINEFEVYYKAWSDLNGPQYQLQLSQVSTIKNELQPAGARQPADSGKAQPKTDEPSDKDLYTTALPKPNKPSRADTLLMKDGRTIAVQILNDNGAEIRYNLWNNADGPVYVVPVNVVAQVKYAGGHAHAVNYSSDTLVLIPGKELVGTVGLLSDCTVDFVPLPDRHRQRTISLPLGYVRLIKYGNGQHFTVNSDQPYRDPHARRNCSYRIEEQPSVPYDQLRYYFYKRAQQGFLIAGLSSMGVGVSLFAGAVIETNNNVIIDNKFVALMCTGAGLLIAGAVIAPLSNYFKYKAVRYKNGLAFISMPHPDFMLPTAQNNYSKGFGLRTGIRF